ncbi:hypothetical protein JANAI62_27410 [Jannaschia pagri]|uniref:Uncharacterized protein n=1 Tax=Jannaschia pagri TaxID=2829797 RepID=A0ABQ4NNX7_9RHOB|nr:MULTISPECIES: hypothetical protein [unclassified Jannaschia]GIT92284.1 hypothetical protein JANAI61_27420 [Jannaschia sp. AI_61]GIT96118.1 hypothetical protein JANAI62_27410 [Jannaschia sp. AI_62]
MTAIEGIDRLETTGLWRQSADDQRQDVFVSIGEAELVVQDKTGATLSHWSLPALVRLNPGKTPARYAPAKDADEELEVEDEDMVTALDRVVKAVAKGQQKPGRLRRILTGLILGAGLGLGIMWLPGAMRDQAAHLLPLAKQQDIGRRMLTELTLLTGPPCETVTGREAMDRLQERILPTTPARIEVLRDLPHPALALPGDLLVLSDTPLLTQDDPDVVAGHLLAAALTAKVDRPLVAFLSGLNTLDLLRLLSAGEVTDAQVTAHVEGLLLDAPPLLPAGELRTGFAAARLAWGEYAAVAGLPRGVASPSDMTPSLDDTGWQTLREMCDA